MVHPQLPKQRDLRKQDSLCFCKYSTQRRAGWEPLTGRNPPTSLTMSNGRALSLKLSSLTDHAMAVSLQSHSLTPNQQKYFFFKVAQNHFQKLKKQVVIFSTGIGAVRRSKKRMLLLSSQLKAMPCRCLNMKHSALKRLINKFMKLKQNKISISKQSTY